MVALAQTRRQEFAPTVIGWLSRGLAEQMDYDALVRELGSEYVASFRDIAWTVSNAVTAAKLVAAGAVEMLRDPRKVGAPPYPAAQAVDWPAAWDDGLQLLDTLIDSPQLRLFDSSAIGCAGGAREP